jgi:hypothetical protein
MPEPLPEPDNPPAPTGDPVDDVIARIKEHQAACEKLGWKASDATEYAQFQLLALKITEASRLADSAGLSELAKERLLRAVREAIYSLSAEEWPDDAAWIKTNDVAGKALDTPGEGVFALGRVLVPTSAGNVFDGAPVAIVELVDSEAKQLVAINVASGAEKLRRDQRVLVIGVDSATRITLNDRNDPKVSRIAPHVNCKFVVIVDNAE